jgi:hypothetical protein
MRYETYTYDNGVTNLIINVGPTGSKDIPAWSLEALINLFPAYKDDDMPVFSLTRGGWKPSFTRNWFATWGNWSFDAKEPIDAVVGLILLLKENNVEFYNPLY